jgi:dTMP kinase
MFLVLEGIDGSGKTTLIAHVITPLLQELYAHKVITYTREPGGSAVAEELRRVMMHNELDTFSLLLLMMAARCDHLNKLINPALKQDKIVVCDRFNYSTIAYQHYGFGVDIGLINTLTQSLPQPIYEPITIYLDISPQLARERMKGRASNKFDDLSLGFYSRVRAGYLYAMRDDKNVLYVDSSLPFSAMSLRIQEFLSKVTTE